MHSVRTRSRAVAVAVAIVIALAGCAGGDDASNAGNAGARASESMPAEHGGSMTTPAVGGALDKAFVAAMLPHHQAAVDMAKVEVSRGRNARVKALAQRVIEAQQTEIATLRAAAARLGADPAMVHTGPMGELMGVALSTDMGAMARELEAAADVDTMFLEMMIPHHASAIAMADEQARRGSDPALKELAETIIADQANEIGEMQTLRATV